MREAEPQANPILEQAKRIYENAEFSKDVQFEASKRLTRCAIVLGAMSTVGAAAGGLGLLASGSWLWSICALIAAFTSFLSVANDPSGRAQKSAAVGHQYVKLRNDTDVFMTIDYRHMSESAARQRLDELLMQEDSLNGRISLASDKDAAKVNGEVPWWRRIVTRNRRSQSE